MGTGRSLKYTVPSPPTVYLTCYELIGHRVLYARNNSLPNESFLYTDGSDGILKYVSTNKKPNGVGK